MKIIISVSIARRARPESKEEKISKAITQIFKDKEKALYRSIENAMYEENKSVYMGFRKEYSEKIDELEKERVKILRRKRNKKEK